MADKNLSEPTYLGLGTKRETTFATGIAWGSAAPYLIVHSDPPIRKTRMLVSTDKNEFTGYRGVQNKTVLRWGVARTLQGRLVPHVAILAMALMSGKDSNGDPNVTSAAQGGTAAYRHDIPLDPQVADLFSVTGWQANPLTGNEVLTGLCVAQLKITAKEDDHVRFALQIIGSGYVAAGVDISGGSLPTSEEYLTWADCDLLLGGTFDGSDVSGGTSIKDQVASLELTINLGIELEWQMGGNGTYADAVIVKDIKPEDKGVIAVTLKPEDSTYLDYLASSTETVAEFKITGAQIESPYNFKNSWVFPVAEVVKATPGTDKNIMTADLEIQSKKDDSVNDYAEVYFYGINKITEYLGAAA